MSVDRNSSETDRGPSGAEVLASLITAALENAKLGKTKDYDLLVQKLADPGIKEVHFQRYLMALTTCVSCLTKQHDTLVGAVLPFLGMYKLEELILKFLRRYFVTPTKPCMLSMKWFQHFHSF